MKLTCPLGTIWRMSPESGARDPDAPVRPVQDGAALEMSSQPNQRDARPDGLGVPLPQN